MTTDEKLGALRERLRKITADGVALAYSGGVDSALLLAVLAELRREKNFPLLALTMRSPFSPRGADDVPAGVPSETIDVALADAPAALRENAAERCYFCKRHFFSAFAEIARERGLRTLADGTNADDLVAFRPGLRALRELGVVSPLADAGFGKADVRAAARRLKLSVAEKPSSPCLATRFPTGTHLTEKALLAVRDGEDFLRKFLSPTAPLRLRVHGETARIETAPEAFPRLFAEREKICARLRELSFRRAALDLDGFRSGSMDA